jgi:hypothetical protein
MYFSKIQWRYLDKCRILQCLSLRNQVLIQILTNQELLENFLLRWSPQVSHRRLLIHDYSYFMKFWMMNNLLESCETNSKGPWEPKEIQKSLFLLTFHQGTQVGYREGRGEPRENSNLKPMLTTMRSWILWYT